MNIEQVKEEVYKLVNYWQTCNLSDAHSISELRRNVSAYAYFLAEYKSNEEARFLTLETHRKNEFNKSKLMYISEGKSATEATTRAETDVKDHREKEVQAERNYKGLRDLLGSLDHCLNAMSGAIRLAEIEMKQTKHD